MSRPTSSRDRFEDYVPVAERLERFYERYPDGRITRTKDADHKVSGIEAFSQSVKPSLACTEVCWDDYGVAVPFQRCDEGAEVRPGS